MKFLRAPLSIAVLACLLTGVALDVEAKKKEPATLKDLAGKEVDVPPDPPQNVKPEQAATQYRRFLERNAGDPRLQVEAMRRLGDLNLETDDMIRGDDPSAMTPAELHEAIALYEGLLTKFPDYARADSVMYQLSRAYEADAHPERALVVLTKLVKQFPDSRYAAEAQFRRGEILFTDRNYADAERAYAAVLAWGETTKYYDQGLYKHAWSQFKLSRADDSVSSFLKLLDRVLAPQGKLKARGKLSRPERELTDDAMRAIAITMLDLDGPPSLDSMLSKRGDPVYAHMLYNALGDFYLEKERFQDAALAFEAFAKRQPGNRYAPSLQVRAIEAYQKGGFGSLVLSGKQAFVERYAFGSAFWSNRTVKQAPEVADQLKNNLKDLAQYYHAQAQKNKKDEDYAAATRWYRAILKSFPKDPTSAESQFLLGELLSESGRFGEAAQEYERAAYEYPAHARSAQAGYSALVSYQKHEPTLAGDARASWHKKGIESALMFAMSFPQHPEAGAVQTKAAEDLFELKDFDRTIEVAQLVLARQPPVDTKRQRSVTTILAHSLFDRQRYVDAEAAYLRVQTLLPPNDPDRAAIVERIAASIYKQAEMKQQANDGDGAVNDFLRVATLAPTSKIRANAEFDAASILVKSGQWAKAIPVLEQFRAAHPGHQFNADVTRNLAVGYQETGRGGAAAEEYERVAAQATETPDVRRAAQWQAAELFQKAGNSARAGKAYATYVAQYPTPLDAAMDARQHLADMALAANDYNTRTQWLREIIRVDQAAGSARTDRSRYLAARAWMIDIEPTVANFKSIKLVQPLAKSLKSKVTAMNDLLGKYSRALDYQVAEVTTSATFGMAEVYRQLSADILASERPKKLDADALEQYNVMLEETAYPHEEDAIKLYQANAQRASEGIYDDAVKKSYQMLAKIVPARYSKSEIGESYVPALR